MKKKLFALLLALVLVVSVTVISAMAEESTATPAGHTDHCVCGGSGDGRGDHVCADSGVITGWTAFTEELLVATDNTNRYTLAGGNYYLTADMTLTGKEIVILPDQEVTFCLNGFELTGTRRIFRVNGILNITDCQPTRDGKTQNGKITGNAGNGSVFYGYSGGHINLYRGILTAKTGVTRNWGGVGALGTDAGAAATKGSSSMTMYGGNINASQLTLVKDGSSHGNGGALVLMGATEDRDGDGTKETTNTCTFIQYGGTINAAKSVGNYGAAIYGNGMDTIKILGGTVTAGKASNSGNGVTKATGDGELVVGGNCEVADLYLRGGQTFTTENLTGSVGLSTTIDNTAALTTCTEAEAACFKDMMELRALATTEVDGVYQVSYVSEHTAHCVCGGNLTDEAAIAAHGECVVQENWIALTNDNLADYLVESDANDGGGADYYMFADDYDEASFYLAENITIKKPIEIHNGDSINLCLNGYKYTYQKGYTLSAFRVWGNLNLCDCTGDGVATTNNTGGGGLIYMLNQKGAANVNIYGGTYTATDNDLANSGGVIRVGVSTEGETLSDAVVNLYGGAITGGTGAMGGNIYLDRIAGYDCVVAFNMYGGAVTNGRAKTRGGNVYVNHGTFNMYGGEITGGSLTETGFGADLAMGAPNAQDASIVLDGKVTIGQIGVWGSAMAYSVSLGENFETSTPIEVSYSAASSSGYVVFAQYAKSYEIKNDFYTTDSENFYVTAEKSGDYYTLRLRPVTQVYHCRCGGAPTHESLVHSCYDVAWTELTAELLATFTTTTNDGSSYVIPAGSYILNADLTVDKCLRIENDTTVNLDLNGHTLTDNGSAGTKILRVAGSLNVCDSSYNAQGETEEARFQGQIIATKEAGGSLVYVSKGTGKMILYGGNLKTAYTESSVPTYAAVTTSGELYISGGTVTGANLTSSNSGGTISVFDNADMRVYGGVISGGTAVRGGNICAPAAASYVRIFGGEITGGTALGAASGTNGGGGNIYSTGTVTISGGTITGGTASRTQSSAQAYGGNIYHNGSTKTMTISGGTISGGTAVTGGNIFVRGTFEMTGGTISNGIATEAIGGNVRVEGNIKNGTGACNITGGTFIGGTAMQQGGSLILRNLPSESIIKNASFTGGISTDNHGGNIYMVGLEGNVTMENVTIADGVSANRAGNLYITAAVEGVTATLTNVTITNGQAVDRGGNMYFADVACTMTDCTVTGGAVTGNEEKTIGADLYGANIATNTGNFATSLIIDGGNYSGLGENNISLTSVHVLSSDDPYTITVTGAPVIDDLRLGTDRMLTVGELTEGANIGISRFEITGIFAPDAAAYAEYFTGVTEGTSVAVEGEDLVLVSSIPYWAFDVQCNVIAPAATIADAMAMENASFVRLVSDYASTETYTGDLYLDLYGHDLSGLTVNGNLYVVDYATNDYEEGVAGSFSGTVSGTINDGKTVYSDAEKAHFNVANKYVKIANEDGSYGFHRVSVSITHISLKADDDALGFKATIYGDSAVQAAVTGIGFNMGIDGLNMVSYSKTGTPTDGVFTLRLKNILKNNGGELTIVGQPVIFFGEESVTGGNKTTSMKNTIEAVETALAENDEAYTKTQIESVQALIAQYESKMEGWDIDSIKAWTAPSTEEETTAA